MHLYQACRAHIWVIWLLECVVNPQSSSVFLMGSECSKESERHSPKINIKLSGEGAILHERNSRSENVLLGSFCSILKDVVYLLGWMQSRFTLIPTTVRYALTHTTVPCAIDSPHEAEELTGELTPFVLALLFRVYFCVASRIPLALILVPWHRWCPARWKNLSTFVWVMKSLQILGPLP